MFLDGTLKLYSVPQDKQLHSCSPSSMVGWFNSLHFDSFLYADSYYSWCCFFASCHFLHCCCVCCIHFSRYHPSVLCLTQRLLLLVAGTTTCTCLISCFVVSSNTILLLSTFVIFIVTLHFRLCTGDMNYGMFRYSNWTVSFVMCRCAVLLETKVIFSIVLGDWQHLLPW